MASAARRRLDILAIGEPLIELSAAGTADEPMFRPGFGGDTSNCVIAAARQGAAAAYATCIGEDAFGSELLRLWEREGVDRSMVRVIPGARTGIYFIDYGPDGHRFSYYRAGSAASTMRDLDEAAIAGARILHASGISQAIGEGPCDAVFRAMRLAKAGGGLVSYDTNLRCRCGRSTGRVPSSMPPPQSPTSSSLGSTTRVGSWGSTTRTRSATATWRWGPGWWR